MGLPSGDDAWLCYECKKTFTDKNDKLMECDFCADRYCIKCLGMSPTQYNYLAKSEMMWFCVKCMPKVRETIKIEKEIEEKCNAHYEKFTKRCDEIDERCSNIETQVAEKISKNDVEQMIDTKINSLFDGGKINQATAIPVQNQTEIKQIVEGVVSDKLAENEKDIIDRKKREKNIVLFNLPEPETSLINERIIADGESIKKLIDFLNMETVDGVEVEETVRLGARKENPKDNPRPTIVKFTTIEAKKKCSKKCK